MKTTRLAGLAVVGLLTLTLGSCSEGPPTSPVAPVVEISPSNDAELLGILTQPVQHLGLLTCKPMPAASASATIGATGGTIIVGPHRLTVPAGALTSPVTITASAPTSSVNRVEFQPHGLTFNVPATLSMSYANCDLLGSLLPKRIAYIDGSLDILYYLISVDNLWQKRVSTRLDHFSEYAIAW
jgi:hypothetical protein